MDGIARGRCPVCKGMVYLTGFGVISGHYYHETLCQGSDRDPLEGYFSVPKRDSDGSIGRGGRGYPGEHDAAMWTVPPWAKDDGQMHDLQNPGCSFPPRAAPAGTGHQRRGRAGRPFPPGAGRPAKLRQN